MPLYWLVLVPAHLSFSYSLISRNFSNKPFHPWLLLSLQSSQKKKKKEAPSPRLVTLHSTGAEMYVLIVTEPSGCLVILQLSSRHYNWKEKKKQALLLHLHSLAFLSYINSSLKCSHINGSWGPLNLTNLWIWKHSSLIYFGWLDDTLCHSHLSCLGLESPLCLVYPCFVPSLFIIHFVVISILRSSVDVLQFSCLNNLYFLHIGFKHTHTNILCYPFRYDTETP